MKPTRRALIPLAVGALATVVLASPTGMSLGNAAKVAVVVNHSFPDHVTYRLGVLPSASASARDAAVEKAYTTWKKTYLVKGCASNEYYVSTMGDGLS